MKYSDDQGKMMIEHPIDRKKSLFFPIICNYLFSLFTKEKKDQHFNRKKTRENHLYEGM